MRTEELIAAVRPVLAGALIATDFDGTLAPLQLDPEKSRAAPGAIEAMQALVARGARVAVITGRDARTVVRLGGLDAVPGLQVAGMYGIEMWSAGRLETPDQPVQLDELRGRLPDLLAAADPDLWVEDKRLSLVVHARRCADPAAALTHIDDRLRQLAEELGLEVHPGSGVLEVRLPGYDKGATLRSLAGGASAVVFAGDDLGDLPAFEQIVALRAAGVPAYSIGVLASQVAGVEAACDVAVADPAAAVALLAELGRA